MKADIQDLKLFSACPAYYKFSRQSTETRPTILSRQEILSQLIKRIYMERTYKGQALEWRKVIGWVNELVFKDINPLDPVQFEFGRKQAELLLQPLSKWFRELPAEDVALDSFIDVPIERLFGPHSITATIPVIKLSDPVTIGFFGDRILHQFELVNDLIARGYAYLVSKELNLKTICVEYVYIGPAAGLEITKIEIKKSLNDRLEKTLMELLVCMASQVSYPSRTSMCQSCIYAKGCSL